MKRGTRFLIGLTAAGLTFGTLVAFVGKPNTDHHGFRNHGACMEQQHGKNGAKMDSLKSK